MSSLIYWIWLAETYPGPKQLKALLARFGDPKGVFFAQREEIAALDIKGELLERLCNKELDAPRKILSRCDDINVAVITLQDAAYPERLRNMDEPPCVLYVKGRLPDVDSEAVVAIVGTRRCSPYGAKMARDIGFEIASKGGLVCTGLAEGIDSRSAEGALMAGGRVIGVLGTGIDEVFPKFNGPLFEDVAFSGAIISEYPPGYKANKLSFPRRNRIIAGLSLGVVVVEAPVRSGALITARIALENGRDVFAVPSNADSPGGAGTNNLLREGAIFTENGWDVLREYAERFPDRINEKGQPLHAEDMKPPEDNSPGKESVPAEKLPEEPGKGFFKLRIPVRRRSKEDLAKQLSDLTESQLKIVSVMNKPSMHVDDIIDLSALPAAKVLSELTLLQIKGYVSQEAGKRFTLNIK